jgi:hypothetical protein
MYEIGIFLRPTWGRAWPETRFAVAE